MLLTIVTMRERLKLVRPRDADGGDEDDQQKQRRRDGDGEVNELCQHEEKKKKSRDSHREGPKIIPKMALRWVIFITNENSIIKIILIKIYQKIYNDNFFKKYLK